MSRLRRPDVWWTSHPLLLVLSHNKMACGLQRAGINLHQHIVHHTRRVLLRSLRIQTRTVRHCAGWYPRYLGHRLCRDNGNRRWDHVAVKIEVDHEKKTAVRRNVEGGGKVSEGGFSNHRIVFG